VFTNAGIMRPGGVLVFESTDIRARRSIGDATGPAALRLLCLEVMPFDDVRLLESRAVIAFWDPAVHDPRMAEVNEKAIGARREQMRGCLEQARRQGDITTGAPDDEIVDTLLAALMGFQINAVPLPHTTTPRRQEAVLDSLVDLSEVVSRSRPSTGAPARGVRRDRRGRCPPPARSW